MTATRCLCIWSAGSFRKLLILDPDCRAQHCTCGTRAPAHLPRQHRAGCRLAE